MKKLFKKYWIGLAIIILIPFLVNAIVLFPNGGVPVAGNPIAWIGFFACYFSSIVTAIISFVILYKTILFNQKENELNRALQNNLMLYQIGHDNLKSFKEASNIFCRALSYNNLVEIVNIFILDSKSPIPRIKQEFANVVEAERLSQFYIIAEPSKDFFNLVQEQDKVISYYNTVLMDFEVIVSYLNLSIPYIKSHILIDEHSSQILRELISRNFKLLDSLEPKKWLDKILTERIELVNPKFIDNTWSLISKIHLNEINRLKNLLESHGNGQAK